MQKCTRCNHTLGKTIDGWKTCPKCGKGQFVGQKTTKNDAEKVTQPLPSPTEKQGKNTTSKVK